MTNQIQWVVQPNLTDSTTGIDVSLPEYIVSATYTETETYTAAVVSGASYVTLPQLSVNSGIELISDQPLSLKLTTTVPVATVFEWTSVYNFILSGAVTNTVSTYVWQIKNNSGSTANITWRVYK